MVLTDAERLLLRRRRLGVSQKVMAKKLNITQCTYASYERDEERQFRHAPPLEIPDIEDLADFEIVTLLRIRAGLTLAQAADVVGTSRATYVQIEGGGRVTDKWAKYSITKLLEQQPDGTDTAD